MQQLELFLAFTEDGWLRTATADGYVLDNSTYDAINRAIRRILPLKYDGKLSLLNFTPQIINALLKQGFKIHIVRIDR